MIFSTIHFLIAFGYTVAAFMHPERRQELLLTAAMFFIFSELAEIKEMVK
jgi:hypothetical protein